MAIKGTKRAPSKSGYSPAARDHANGVIAGIRDKHVSGGVDADAPGAVEHCVGAGAVDISCGTRSCQNRQNSARNPNNPIAPGVGHDDSARGINGDTVGLQKPGRHGGRQTAGGDAPHHTVIHVSHDQIGGCWIDGDRERIAKPDRSTGSIRRSGSLSSCQRGDVARRHDAYLVVTCIGDVQAGAAERNACCD